MRLTIQKAVTIAALAVVTAFAFPLPASAYSIRSVDIGPSEVNFSIGADGAETWQVVSRYHTFKSTGTDRTNSTHYSVQLPSVNYTMGTSTYRSLDVTMPLGVDGLIRVGSNSFVLAPRYAAVGGAPTASEPATVVVSNFPTSPVSISGTLPVSVNSIGGFDFNAVSFLLAALLGVSGYLVGQNMRSA